MTDDKRVTKHDTLVLERTYRATPERVFAAWSDPALRRLWDVPGEGWELTAFESDFRVGGREYSRFGPPHDPRYRSDGLYLDIVPNRRIVSAGTMYDGDVRTAVTLGTIELFVVGEGTRLRLTDQSVFLDGREDVKTRASGYGTVLDKLEKFFAEAQQSQIEEGN